HGSVGLPLRIDRCRIRLHRTKLARHGSCRLLGVDPRLMERPLQALGQVAIVENRPAKCGFIRCARCNGVITPGDEGEMPLRMRIEAALSGATSPIAFPPSPFQPIPYFSMR